MTSSNSRGGGIFIILAILGGTIWGVVTGQHMLGVLSGTGVGAALAIATWLIDRRRAR